MSYEIVSMECVSVRRKMLHFEMTYHCHSSGVVEREVKEENQISRSMWCRYRCDE